MCDKVCQCLATCFFFFCFLSCFIVCLFFACCLCFTVFHNYIPQLLIVCVLTLFVVYCCLFCTIFYDKITQLLLVFALTCYYLVCLFFINFLLFVLHYKTEYLKDCLLVSCGTTKSKPHWTIYTISW